MKKTLTIALKYTTEYNDALMGVLSPFILALNSWIRWFS